MGFRDGLSSENEGDSGEGGSDFSLEWLPEEPSGWLPQPRRVSPSSAGLLVEASGEVIAPVIAVIIAGLWYAQSIGSMERGLAEILSRHFHIEGVLDEIPSSL